MTKIRIVKSETPDGVFNPDMLEMARASRGKKQRDIAVELGVNQGRVSRWEDGLSTPTDQEIDRLAETLGVSRRFFFQPEKMVGAEMSFVYHRKRRRATQSALSELHGIVNVMRIGISRLLRSVDDYPVRIEHMDIEEYDNDPEQVAKLVRAAWQIPQGPIRDLIGLVEEMGAIVVRIPFPTDLIDALFLWPWGLPPLIFVNRSCPADRERFSIAHEVGHMVMHRIPTLDMEKEADRFGRELLLPADALAPDVHDLTLREAIRLKQKWRASAQAIIYQAHQVGAISNSKYQGLYKYISKLGYRKNEPGPIEREQPTTLNRLIDLHRTTLKMSLAQISELVFLTEERFSELYLAQDAPRLKIAR